MTKNTKVLLWALGAVVVFAVIYLAVAMRANVVPPAGENTTPTQPTTNTSANPSPQGSNSQQTIATTPNMSYDQALVVYANRRIQLDGMCQAHPNTVTYKDNTGIMIDNRSPQNRTVTIGSKFTIPAWGFKIVTLPDVALKNSTILVDCDQYQNVATILVQE